MRTARILVAEWGHVLRWRVCTGEKKMSQLLGAFGLLDFTMLRPILIWRAFWSLWNVYLLSFQIYFLAAVNSGYWISGYGGTTVYPWSVNIKKQGHTYVKLVNTEGTHVTILPFWTATCTYRTRMQTEPRHTGKRTSLYPGPFGWEKLEVGPGTGSQKICTLTSVSCNRSKVCTSQYEIFTTGRHRNTLRSWQYLFYFMILCDHITLHRYDYGQ
jgi:hypothetical protein